MTERIITNVPSAVETLLNITPTVTNFPDIIEACNDFYTSIATYAKDPLKTLIASTLNPPRPYQLQKFFKDNNFLYTPPFLPVPISPLHSIGRLTLQTYVPIPLTADSFPLIPVIAVLSSRSDDALYFQNTLTPLLESFQQLYGLSTTLEEPITITLKYPDAVDKTMTISFPMWLKLLTSLNLKPNTPVKKHSQILKPDEAKDSVMPSPIPTVIQLPYSAQKIDFDPEDGSPITFQELANLLELNLCPVFTFRLACLQDSIAQTIVSLTQKLKPNREELDILKTTYAAWIAAPLMAYQRHILTPLEEYTGSAYNHEFHSMSF